MKKHLPFILLFFFITSLFFYPIFKGWIPFPGDLLVSHAPYNVNSYFGYAPGGVPNKAQGPDVIHEFFPWKFFVIESLKKGVIPFWTPYNFSGNTIMANFQSNVFYPGNIVFFVAPFLQAWTIYIFLAPFLAAFFTYLFLRELQLSRSASAFGGVVFAFSSYMVVWMEYGNITHTLMWLPLALYFTEKYIQKRQWYFILFLIVSLWFSFLAGYIQGFFYLFVVTLLYFLVKTPKPFGRNRKKTIIFFFALTFPILLSLFQLLPTLALFTMSSRGNYTLTQITQLLNPWWYSITVLVPDFFGHPASRNSWFYGTYIERVSYFGVIPLLLALIALISSKKKELIFFAALFVIIFFFTLDLFITRFFYLLPIPILSTTVPTRILSIFIFSGAVLSAYGFDLLLQGRQRKQFMLISFVSITFLGVLWSYVLFFSNLLPTVISTENLAVTKRNLILPTVFVMIIFALVVLRWTKITKRLPHAPTIIAMVIFVAVIGDLFYFFHKITPFSPREFVYPKTSVTSYLQNNAGIYRFWGYGSAYIDSNFQTYNKTFTPEGFDALHLRWYTEFLSASKDGKKSEVVSRDNANIAPGYGAADMQSNQFRQKVLDLLGVKYILHKDDGLGEGKRPDVATFIQERYALVWQKAPLQIYENLTALSRVKLFYAYEVIMDKKEIIKRFYHDDFDYRNVLILEKKPEMANSEERMPNGKTSVISYSPNKVLISVETDQPGLLFLSDTYSPNWQATIDGKKAEVLLADYAFRAVAVPKGNHTVTFFYKDKLFETGLLFSAVFAGVAVVFMLLLKKKIL